MAINKKANQMMQGLKEANLMWEQVIPPMQMLVHPANRSGQMLNCHDAHSKGAMVLTIGCCPEKLHGSLCIEVSKDPVARKKQLDSNMQLVEASSSLLSPVGGQERFLTLSSSHMTAFMKAVMSGNCCTLEPSLQQVNGGRLTEDAIATFYQDEAFNQCAKEGWLWKVLASEVEAELEWIPGFFQGAMNTSQQVHSVPTEMEQAMSIAWWYGKSGKVEDAVAQTKASMPLSAQYLKTIAQWVVKYGGGDSFELVKLLQSISKQFGGSVLLGADFLQAVVELDFKNKSSVETSTYPFLRTALIGTQLCCPKTFIKDRVAKLLSKADIDRLKSPQLFDCITMAEKLMVEGWKLLQGTASLAYDKKCLLMGRLMTRLVLFVVQKQSKSKEGKTYASLQEINATFGEEVVYMGEWGKLPPQTKKDEKAEAMTPVPMRDTTDPKFIAFRRFSHIGLGKLYTEKDDPTKVFKFIEMKETTAVFCHQPFFGEKEIKEVQHLELKMWKEWSKDEPALFEKDMLLGMGPCRKLDSKADKVKSELQSMLFESFLEHGEMEVVFPNTHQLFASKRYKKGELKLFPWGGVAIIEAAKAKDNACLATKDGICAQVSPPRCDLKKGEGTFVPFFHLKPQHLEENVSNMEKATLKTKDATVPYLRNKKALEIGTELLLDEVEKPAKKPRKK